jgi:ABC-type antimicrobial peptide transport system permease subunit
MNAKLVKIASSIGLSTFRHTFGGVPLAASFGFSYFEVVTYTSIGGILGVGFFLLLASSFAPTLRKWFPKKPGRKIFSRRNRFLVKVKKNFGLAGIAFLTPWFLSVPLGTIISYGIYKSRRKVFLYQSLAILFWSLAGAALAQPLAALF